MEKKEKCPECGSSNLIYDYNSGEIICGNCGLIKEKIINQGPEWRAFTKEQQANRSRVGMPQTLIVHHKGLPTTLKPIYRDASGKALSSERLFDIKRLSDRQERSRVSSTIEKNLALATTELNRLSDHLNIPPSVRGRAAVLYRKALAKRLLKGRSIMAMVAACLYAACRQTEILRSLQEIAEVSPVDKKTIGRCYCHLVQKLEIKMPVTDPIKFVSKIGEKLGISGKTQGLAIQILHKAKAIKKTSGKDPRSLAAGALYIACRKNNEKKKELFGIEGYITQKDIADAARVTEVTVRNRYKEMVEELNLELSEKEILSPKNRLKKHPCLPEK